VDEKQVDLLDAEVCQRLIERALERLGFACRDAGFDPRIVASTGDALATRGLISRGLGVGWVASLLVNDYDCVAVRPVKDPIHRRDIYALLPPGGRHPFAKHVIDALAATAAQINAPPNP